MGGASRRGMWKISPESSPSSASYLGDFGRVSQEVGEIGVNFIGSVSSAVAAGLERTRPLGCASLRSRGVRTCSFAPRRQLMNRVQLDGKRPDDEVTAS